MNAARYVSLLGLVGLLTGCVTPTDMGYAVPAEPVYTTPVYNATPVYNSSPAYYATPVSGYSTMTVYDGYHPGYGGPHYPHHRPPPPRAFGRDHGGHGGHGGHGHHGGRPGHGAPGMHVGAPASHSRAPSLPAAGTRLSSGSPKRTPINQIKPPSRRSAPSRAPAGKGGSFGKGGGGRKK